MSYSASDLASDVVLILEGLGYEINDHNFAGAQEDERGGWSWTFADAYTCGQRFDEGMLADINALRDYCDRAEELKCATARALSRWDSGDLAEAMRALQAALDASVPVSVEEFIQAHA